MPIMGFSSFFEVGTPCGATPRIKQHITDNITHNTQRNGNGDGEGKGEIDGYVVVIVRGELGFSCSGTFLSCACARACLQNYLDGHHGESLQCYNRGRVEWGVEWTWTWTCVCNVLSVGRVHSLVPFSLLPPASSP